MRIFFYFRKSYFYFSKSHFYFRNSDFCFRKSHFYFRKSHFYFRKSHWLFLCACLAPALWAQTPAATPGALQSGPSKRQDTPEQAARRASEQGDYEQALALYDAAIKKGGVKTAVFYNRAATLYKLNRLPEAKKAFAELLKDAQWADLGRYNLGLIAERQGAREEALVWYRQVKQNTGNARLQTIAERKIIQLHDSASTQSGKSVRQSDKPLKQANKPLKQANKPVKQADKPSASARKNTLLISVGAVADDNATGLAEELSGSSSQAKDIYLQGLLYGHTYWGNSKVYGLAQAREFQKFDDFNTRVVGAGMEWTKQRHNWQWRYGLRALTIAVARGTLANQFTVNVIGQKQWANNTLELRNNLSRFDAAADYRHLQGWQNQLQAAWQKKWGNFSLEPQLGWEINNRTDKARANTYYSYSPTIFSGQLKTALDISAAWQIRAEAEWAQADYEGVNRLTDVGGIHKNQSRHYDRTTLSLGARYRLHRQWYIKLDYQHAETDDVFALYSFSKNTVAAKIEFVR